MCVEITENAIKRNEANKYAVAHSLLKDKNGEYTLVFNKKWNQYAPIGGKLDGDEQYVPVQGLIREIVEEVGLVNITGIKMIQEFQEPFDRNGVTINPRAVLYIVEHDGYIKETEEEFLSIVKLNKELIASFEYGVNTYTCLKPMIEYVAHDVKR